MIASEAAQVLTLAAGYDGRTVTPESAIAWAEVLERCDFQDALHAVKVHYRSSRKWLMPADIAEAAARLTQDREREQLQSLGHRDRSEKACMITACACTHTACTRGWLDTEGVIERNGQTYPAVARCGTCANYAEAAAADRENGWSR